MSAHVSLYDSTSEAEEFKISDIKGNLGIVFVVILFHSLFLLSKFSASSSQISKAREFQIEVTSHSNTVSNQAASNQAKLIQPQNPVKSLAHSNKQDATPNQNVPSRSPDSTARRLENSPNSLSFIEQKNESESVQSLSDSKRTMVAEPLLSNSAKTELQGSDGVADKQATDRSRSERKETQLPLSSQSDFDNSSHVYHSKNAKNKMPAYPFAAKRLRQEGTVVLVVDVINAGTVGDIRIAESSGSEILDRAALEAVKSWIFDLPRDPQGTTTKVRVPIIFKL